MTNKNIFTEKFLFILLSVLPIGLLVSSGVAESIVITISALFLLECFYKKDFSFIKNKYFILLLMFWCSLIINQFFSKNSDLSFYRNITFVKYIIFVFAINTILKKEEYRNLIFKIWLYTVIIVTLDIYFEYIFGHNVIGLKSIDPTRIASFLGKELKIAHFVLGFSFIVLGFCLEKYNNSIKKKYYIFLIFFLFFTSILLTGERANSLKFVLVTILFIALSRNKIFKSKILILSFIFFLPYCTYIISERIKLRVDTILIPISNKGIFETFKETQHGAHAYTAINIFKNYPMFGIGNKNFREECFKENYQDNSYARIKERCSTHPHQIYYELLSEHGLTGTLILTVVIIINLYKSFLIYKKYYGMVHLASILFVFSTFLPFIPSGSFFVNWNATIFWLNFGIMLFYNNNSSNKLYKN